MAKTKTKVQRLSTEIHDAIEKYCTALQWDVGRLKTALYSVGLSDANIYLEDPNDSVIAVMAEFLTFSGSSIFVVYAENGMGKTALKEFTMRTFVTDPRFNSFSIDHPGVLTEFTLAAFILHNLTGEREHPKSTALTLEKIEENLILTRKTGRITLIWIDEGQKLSSGQIEILRSISDIKTPEGDLVCKILIVGTMDLKAKIETWTYSKTSGPISDKNVDEARAFDDRCGFYTMHLKPWSEQHIQTWWQLLADIANTQNGPATNPFDAETAKTVLTASQGKPRTIVQLTQMALNTRAQSCLHNPQAPLTITPSDVESALDVRLEGVPA